MAYCEKEGGEGNRMAREKGRGEEEKGREEKGNE